MADNLFADRNPIKIILSRCHRQELHIEAEASSAIKHPMISMVNTAHLNWIHENHQTSGATNQRGQQQSRLRKLQRPSVSVAMKVERKGQQPSRHFSPNKLPPYPQMIWQYSRKTTPTRHPLVTSGVGGNKASAERGQTQNSLQEGVEIVSGKCKRNE